MTTYTRKPTIAQAWQYTKQTKAEWPQWVRDYEVATTMGLQPIGAGPGVLLIPQKNGPTTQVISGEWLVLEGAVAAVDGKAAIPGRIRVYKDEEFQEQFEAPVRGSDHNDITVVKDGQGDLRDAAEAEVAAANPPVVDAADLVVPVPGTPAGDAVVEATSGDPVIEPAPTSTPAAKPGKAGEKKPAAGKPDAEDAAS